LYETQDWQLFLDGDTLPQKAGCYPENLSKIVLKELVDNALDAGANASIKADDENHEWIVSDDGPGLDPGNVPNIFCVNRPLCSSKKKRLPLRGMLGNGLRVVMGAVCAFDGSISVETRGHRMALAVDKATGKTLVLSNDIVTSVPGVTVRLSLGRLCEDDAILARNSIVFADGGTDYRGQSSPWWYGVRDLERLLQCVTPATATVSDVIADLGLTCDDRRVARSLKKEDIDIIFKQLRAQHKPVAPAKIGTIGNRLAGFSGYAISTGEVTTQSGAHIPYAVEAWANSKRTERKGHREASVSLVLNKSQTVVNIYARDYYTDAFALSGCGMSRAVRAKAGIYNIWISIIAPYIPLATDGKEPSLAMFGKGIEEVVRKACGQAYRAMEKPERKMNIKEAAYCVMAEAYQLASGEGAYPAEARQVMYAARRRILELTGHKTLNDVLLHANAAS
jgi:hypothetical protein